ncbi:MAG TPA: GNAT family N-acetyltransferase, partial [Candidatus Eisenbacteria bacterium]
NLNPETLAVLFRHLVRSHRGLGSLSFSPMDPTADGSQRLFRALGLAGLVSFKFFCFANWFLRAPASWDDYLASRSVAQREVIGRAVAKLSVAGARVEIITLPADVERGMAAYERVFDASAKRGQPFPEFINGLARGSAERGELRLGVVWLEDRPVAVQLWLAAQGMASVYKLAHDESCRDLAPDNGLFAALLRHVIEQDGVREVDCLIGNDICKSTWMEQSRQRWGVVAFNPMSPAGLAGALAHQVMPPKAASRRRF